MAQDFENIESVVSIVCESEWVYYCIVVDCDQSEACPQSQESDLP